MRWLYENHGLRTEPSGAITIAAALTGKVSLDGDGDVVIVISGRNVDDDQFLNWVRVE
jgi:threonine dehydratase